MIDAETLLQIYFSGAFPMWDETAGRISLFRPDPRVILDPAGHHVPRRLERRIARRPFRITTDRAFNRVLEACHLERDDGCWCSPDMALAYEELHEMGIAHSVEAWREDTLVGGLYGVSIGTAFMAESMFSRPALGGTDASKIVLVQTLRHLNRSGCVLFDVQFENDHLRQFQPRVVTSREYLDRLSAAVAESMTWPDVDGEPVD